jgi:lysozyme family protein
MNNFDRAFECIILAEGGYVNNPLDKGGKTKFGITQSLARAYQYLGDIDDLPIDFAQKIYRAEFWDRMNMDSIGDFDIAYKLFDIAVNCGYKKSVSIFQRSINLFNTEQVAIDGVMGRSTLSAFNRIKPTRYPALLKAIKGLQAMHYIIIAENNTSQKEFIAGWLNRV